MAPPDDVILHPALQTPAPLTENAEKMDLGAPPAPEPARWTDEAGRLLLAEIAELAARRGFRLSAEVEVIEGAVFRARPVLRRA
jgi:hypothetical protein